VAAKNQILSKEVAERKMQRIALEIAAQLYSETEPLIIIGIAGSGMVIADKLFLLLKPLLQVPIQIITCTLDKKNADVIYIAKKLILTIKTFCWQMMLRIAAELCYML
jgi:pyrimidine operon attenuation protein/uracil phosphoribosyltransferase